MTFRLSKLLTAFFVLLFFGAWVGSGFADPFANVSPSEDLYQRVKKLEAYGLLDPQDQAVLDQGKVVTLARAGFLHWRKPRPASRRPNSPSPKCRPPRPSPP